MGYHRSTNKLVSLLFSLAMGYETYFLEGKELLIEGPS